MEDDDPQLVFIPLQKRVRIAICLMNSGPRFLLL